MKETTHISYFMKPTTHFFLLVFLLMPSLLMAVESPVDYVSTLVGTMSKHSLSTGNTYPAIAMPWGMNFWTPQTGDMGDGWAYTYTADKIKGLKQTHQPSPWINDYGQFALMPVVSDHICFDQNERASWFSHKAETATPYYYKVYLADWDVVAELAPTDRAAILRLTYPESPTSRLVVDAFDGGSSVTIDASRQRITGYTTKNSGGVPDNFRNYFVIEVSKPFLSATVLDGGKPVTSVDGKGRPVVGDSSGRSVVGDSSPTITSNHAGADVSFATCRGEQVIVRIASSFISLEQAERNLQELGGRSFDEVCQSGRNRWNEVLGRIEVGDSKSPAPNEDIDHLRTFYSCLYRSVLFPRSFYEIGADGKPLHYSPYNGQVLPGYMFTDTGFWDTFRCLFPLLNLVYPSMNEKMQAGLVNTYLESGFLPEWASPGHRGCMVGNNSASIVADGYLKLRESLGRKPDYDVERLWEAVKHGANAVHPTVPSTGRLGYEEYNRLGYVPYDTGIRESAARTLEYAYDDWCILQLGKALGKPESELAPFRRHALNYKNLFDPTHHLMRGRNHDGQFQSPFNPLKWGDAFTEGNSWHYTWSVFHDPAGLIRLMGSDAEFAHMLDSVFAVPPVFDESYYGSVIHEIREMQIMNMGNYAHGNQPIQHMIYLYDWCRQPWKAQFWLRQVMDRLYSAAPDGYCGDEDNGQTSAWYVFTALGFYPVCPASGEYALGTPYFSSLRVHLENGKTIDISAQGSGPYVSRLQIGGKPYTRNYLRHTDLVKGTRLQFQLSTKPNLQRGIGDDDRPYSFSQGK